MLHAGGVTAERLAESAEHLVRCHASVIHAVHATASAAALAGMIRQSQSKKAFSGLELVC